MHNLSLHLEINPDSELDALLQHKLLGLDDVDGLGEVHGDVLPALHHEGEGLDDNLPRIRLVDDDSSATGSGRTCVQQYINTAAAVS